MLGQCPLNMFGNHFRRMVLPALQCLYDSLGAGRITQGHGDVAQPAIVADTADGAALRALQESFLAPPEQLDQIRGIETVAWFKILFPGGLRKTVPRADQLAIVAAEYAVANLTAELFRNAGTELDGQIGNAAPRINGVGCDDGLGGANVNALGTVAAVVCNRRVDG